MAGQLTGLPVCTFYSLRKRFIRCNINNVILHQQRCFSQPSSPQVEAIRKLESARPPWPPGDQSFNGQGYETELLRDREVLGKIGDFATQIETKWGSVRERFACSKQAPSSDHFALFMFCEISKVTSRADSTLRSPPARLSVYFHTILGDTLQRSCIDC